MTAPGPASTLPPFGVYNNIIEVGSGLGYSIDANSFPAFEADYNDVYVSGSGAIGAVGGITINNVGNWTLETGNDSHSIWTDPQFVNPAGTDGILGYSGGVDHGSDDNFHVQSTSPTIDAAYPSTDLLNETVPNGNRINLGYDGNTSAAAASSPVTLQVLSPTSLAKLQAGTPYTIQWMSTGLLASQTLTEVNVGGSATGEWNGSEYTVGSQSYSNIGGAVDTSGVTNPAPQSVYQTYAYTIGVGSTLAYQIPVQNGTYTIRLDFMEPNAGAVGSRVFDISFRARP